MPTGPLIAPAALAAALDGRAGCRPTVLDVRWTLGDSRGAERYAAGHIAGSLYVDLERELAAPAGPGGRHPLPDAEDFTRAMRGKGVSRTTPVVTLDAGGGLAAARAWWLLRYFGHPNVACLDGGLAGWSAAGLPLVAAATTPRAGDFTAVPGGMPVLDAEAAARLARAGVLLDARTPERFRGEHEPLDPVAGHIPGAHNHPAADNLEDDGRFLPRAELRRRFAAHGIGAGTSVGAYCGSGVTAAHTVLAAELAGHRAALYVGSWSEWCRDGVRPVGRAHPTRRMVRPAPNEEA